MSNSRAKFLGKMQAIREALSNPLSFDTSPVPSNSSAAVVVRNGCMVMAFCALEAFIRGRALECAQSINQSTVPYTHLPDKLKEALLISTFEGLLNLSRNWDKADRILQFELASEAASSGAQGGSYRFTEYSFARGRSNVATEDLSAISKAFGVKKFWEEAKKVCANAGVSIPGTLEEHFRALASERHKAAHVDTHSVSHSRVIEALPQATAIAFSFDLLISKGVRELNESKIAMGTPPALITADSIALIEVRPHTGTRWAAIKPDATRASTTGRDEERVFQTATGFAKKQKRCVVKKDASGRLSNWISIIE